MPTINRARLTNVHYDDDRKCYPDEHFEYWGENGLIHLDNGGGKSLMLKLMIYSALGMEPSVGRNFLRGMLLQHRRRVSHCMVEWRLDGGKGYLMTGLCFALGESEPKWFHYTVEYTDAHPLDLEHLPVKIDGQMAGYEQFRRFLGDQMREQKVRIFAGDQRGAYAQHLESYRIFRRDLEEILRSNADEGGLTDLFRRYRTSKQLMEGVILPQLARAITSDDTGDLVKSLQTHIEHVWKIPELEKKIAMCQVLDQEIGTLLQVLDVYRNTDNQWRDLLGELHEAAAQARDEMQVLGAEHQQIQVSLAELDNRAKELDWLVQSVGYEEQRLQVEMQQEVLDGEVTRKDRADGTLQDLLQMRDLWRAVNDWVDARTKRAKAVGLRTQIESREKEAPEIEAELRQREAVLKALLEDEWVRLDGEIAAEKARESADIHARDEELQAQSAVTARQMELQKLQGRLQNEQEHLDRKRQVLQGTLGAYALRHPVAALEETEDAIRTLQETIRRVDEAIQSDEEWSEKGSREREQVRDRVQEHRATRDGRKRDLELYQKAASDLSNTLRDAGIERPGERIFDRSVLAEVAVLRDHRLKIQATLAIEMDAETRRQQWLSGESVFLNRDMERVSKVLEGEGYAPLTGLEWLKQQGSNTQERRTILGACPLLPYALVLGEGDFRALSRDADVLQHLFLEAPVPILQRHPRLLEGGAASVDFLLLDHRGVQSFESQDVQALLSDVRESLTRLGRQQARVQDELSNLERAEADTQKFQGQYTPELVSHWRHEMVAQGHLAEEAEVEAARLHQALQDAVSRIKQNRQMMDQEKWRLVDQEQRRQLLVEWMPLYELEPALERQLSDLKYQLSDLLREAQERQERIKGLEGKLWQAQATLFRLNQSVGEIQKDLGKLRHVEADHTQRGEMEAARAACESLRSALLSKQGDVERLHIEASDLEHEADEIIQRIPVLYGVEPETLQGRHEKVSDAEFQSLNAQISVQEQTCRGIGKNVDRMRNVVGKAEGALEQLHGQIIDRFSKPPVKVEGDIETTRRRLREDQDLMAMERQEVLAAREQSTKRLSVMGKAQTSLEAMANSHPYEERRPVNWAAVKERIEAYVKELSQRVQLLRDQREKARLRFGQARNAFEEVMRAHQRDLRLLQQALSDEQALTEQAARQLHAMQQMTQEQIRSIQANMEIHRGMLNNLVQECLMRARKLREAARLMPAYSLVLLPGESRNRRLLQIDYPEAVADEAEAMREHLIRMVDSLEQVDPDKWEPVLREAVEPSRLLDVIVDLGRTQVKVGKVVVGGTATMDTWERLIMPTDAGGWSEGEKYLGVLTVYLCLQSYIRNRLCGSEQSPKVLISDNPFARLNARHLLQPIRQLFEATRTQWICASAHRDPNIFDLFAVHYSIKPVEMGGVYWSKAERRLNSAQFVFLEDPHPLHGPQRQFA